MSPNPSFQKPPQGSRCHSVFPKEGSWVAQKQNSRFYSPRLGTLFLVFPHFPNVPVMTETNTFKSVQPLVICI